MAVRDFVDDQGRHWKAWEVTPESVHPQTRAEDYLADCYRAGWIVFETEDGENKRRLCPPPYAWHEREDVDLLALLERAEVLKPKGGRRSPVTGVPADLPPSTPPDVAAEIPRDESGDVDMNKLNVVRSFHYPGGRVWAVGVVRFPESGGEPVLRFVSGARFVDLDRWPGGWIDFTDEQLYDLLRYGAPRKERWRDGMPTRRFNDPRADPG
jgi:hypothetical protein